MNRLALIEAGRALFAERGYDVPLSAVAKAAGVGQGVLYRHFPTRASLAFAVFAQNVDELERLAARHAGDDGALGVLLGQLLGSVRTSAAFVDAVAHAAAHEVTAWDGLATIEALLAGPLARAQEAGRVRPDLSVDDLLLLVRMAYGAVTTQPDAGLARAAILRVVALVDQRLVEAVEPALA